MRTGFEKNHNGDIVVSYTNIPFDMVYPSPDCDYIEEAEWYIIEEMISRSTLKGLLSEDGELIDKTWNEDTIKYILENKVEDGEDTTNKHRRQDDNKGIVKTESVKIRTLYKRGSSEFVTYVPKLQAILRTVKNFDPEKDVPLHFMVLEPDPEYPLGCSSIM